MTNNILIQFSESEFKQLLKACITESLIASEFGKPESLDKLFNVKEAAEFLDLAPQTLYGFTSNRTIPFIKKGKKLYFQKEDLKKWLSDGRKQTKDEILITSFLKKKGGKNG